MPATKKSSSYSSEITEPQPVAPRPSPPPQPTQWEYLELLVGVGNEIWDSSGRKRELREIQVGDPRFPRHYYSSAPLLNELGREGWEVTGIIGDLSTYILMLKRARPVVAVAEVAEVAPELVAAAEPAPQKRPTRSVSQRLRSEPKDAG